MILEDTKEKPQHNTLRTEEMIMDMVRRGDSTGLEAWASGAPKLKAGPISKDMLRQLQNIFIVTATLSSRAAIEGGLDPEDALTLSDEYIQRCEQLSSGNAITDLQYKMVMEYTKQVEALRIGEAPSQLVSAAANYIRHHINERIRTCDISRALYTGRTYLSARFHKEAGIKLSDFILMLKTDEAKKLLRYTDRSAASIADYLAFSSPAHFSRVFRKYAGMTPGEYRKKL